MDNKAKTAKMLATIMAVLAVCGMALVFAAGTVGDRAGDKFIADRTYNGSATFNMDEKLRAEDRAERTCYVGGGLIAALGGAGLLTVMKSRLDGDK